MREIKFRAWDKYNKQMARKMPRIKLHNNGESFNFEILECDELSVMQYTGLKDKNEVEIYEGDIVTCFDKSLVQPVYNHEIKLPTFYREIWSHGITEDGTWLPDNWEGENLKQVEVIGNIYENPELIEKQQ